jgi:hypothetical protein
VGVSVELTVAADGTALVTRDGARPAQTTLSAGDLAELRRLLADPALIREGTASRGPGVCSDGFQYRLRTPRVSVMTDDCGGRHRPAFAKILDLVRPLLNR